MGTLAAQQVQSIQNQAGTRSNHSANRVLPEDRSIHDWYRFVLSYPPHLVRDYLQRLQASKRERILDPFAGTGTTLVEAKKLGFASVGLESHPMGCLACRVKTTWNLSPAELVRTAERVASAAAGELGLRGVPRDTLALYESPPGINGALRGFSEPEARLLLKDSISPLPLHKALVLRDVIERVAHPEYRDHLRLMLAKTTVVDASNLHFGPEVGLGDIREDAPLIESWLNRVYSMANDLRSHEGTAHVETRVERGDAREAGDFAEPESVDVVITSPPYPNEKDYTRTTRLESVLLGLIRSREELRELKGGLMRSNTRNVYKGDEDETWVRQFGSIQKVAAEIEKRRLELGKTSGFERLYHRVTRHYFGGMARHLATLRPLLRPGARLAYVVGDQASYFRVLIRTGELLAEVAESLGYRVDGIDLFRTRLATATRATLREEALRLSWPG